eukprot:SAG31_NODE_30188_length_384_cov_1.077193_1_plen_71_part_01
MLEFQVPRHVPAAREGMAAAFDRAFERFLSAVNPTGRRHQATHSLTAHFIRGLRTACIDAPHMLSQMRRLG